MPTATPAPPKSAKRTAGPSEGLFLARAAAFRPPAKRTFRPRPSHTLSEETASDLCRCLGVLRAQAPEAGLEEVLSLLLGLVGEKGTVCADRVTEDEVEAIRQDLFTEKNA